jgi:hypothetical protein
MNERFAAMKKSRTFWSLTGALGVVAIGAGVAVAQPIAPVNETVIMQESAVQHGFSSVERVAEKADASASVADSAQSAVSAVSAKSAVSPVSAKSAVSPVSAKSAVSPVSAKSAVSPVSAKSPVSPVSPKSAPSAASAS